MNTQELKELSNRIATIETKLGIVSKPELEEGKWYRVKRGSSIQFNKSKGTGYGINEIGTWVDNCRWMADEGRDNWQEATPQEVEEALVKEAKRRGYVEGVSVIDLEDGKDVFFKKGGGYILSDTSKKLFAHGATVFKDGIWATIIEKQVDKFAELKEAHRNGAIIQYKNWTTKYFLDCPDNLPKWDERTEYRIKPEEKPKVNPRLGRKQERVILDDNNFAHEICTFHEKYKHLAPLVVRFLNKQKTTLADDIQELKDKHPNLRFTITVEDNV